MLRIFYRLLCVLVIGISLTACTSVPDKRKIPIVNTGHKLYFIYHDWHTSILLDAHTFARYSTLAARSQRLQKELAGQGYIRIGWGDGDYFTGKNKGVASATKALIASGYSALQIITYKEQPLRNIPSQTRVSLAITDEAMRRLVDYIDHSFALAKDGELLPLPAYVENAGTFYRAQGRYSLLSNCNTWSGSALQMSGLPIRSSFHLTASSIFTQAQHISVYQRAHEVLSDAD